MKTIIVILFAMLSSMTVKAQNKLLNILPLKNDKVFFTEIIQVDSLSNREIYSKAKHWLAYNCQAITMDSPDELVGRCYVRYGDVFICEAINIKIKEGRYKYEISNFMLRSLNGNDTGLQIEDMPLENYSFLLRKNLYNNVNDQINSLINSLKEFIKNYKDESW
jgi:hypothetical protein